MVATWNDGLFVLSGGGRRQELAGQAVGALARDGRGGTLAVIDDRLLCRRTAVGTWSTVATSELRLECAMQVGEVIYVGTNGAHLLRIGPGGGVEQLHGFDVAPEKNSVRHNDRSLARAPHRAKDMQQKSIIAIFCWWYTKILKSSEYIM